LDTAVPNPLAANVTGKPAQGAPSSSAGVNGNKVNDRTMNPNMNKRWPPRVGVAWQVAPIPPFAAATVCTRRRSSPSSVPYNRAGTPRLHLRGVQRWQRNAANSLAKPLPRRPRQAHRKHAGESDGHRAEPLDHRPKGALAAGCSSTHVARRGSRECRWALRLVEVAYVGSFTSRTSRRRRPTQHQRARLHAAFRGARRSRRRWPIPF